MWRAWGIVLLALSQDPPYSNEDHEFSFRPPADWARKIAVSPEVVKFVPNSAKPAAQIVVTHYHSPNPTPLASFVAQGKGHIAEKFKGAAITEEKPQTIGGRPAHRIVFTHGDYLHLKTILFRSNLEYYLLDAQIVQAEAPQYRAVAEQSLATFEIAPRPLSSDERAAADATREAVAGGRVRPELLGEQWHAIYFANKKVGRQRTLLAEVDGKYSLEVDVLADYGEGGKDTSMVRGSFSPDWTYQKVDLERTKESKTDRWQFRASAVLQGGTVRVGRDLNGAKEERTFPVEGQVFFDDVSDVARRMIVLRGKGRYLLRSLSAYAEEPDAELLEVNDQERMDVEGKKREARVVFSAVDRRRNETYYYLPDATLLRLGGPRDVFSLRAASKEGALKP